MRNSNTVKGGALLVGYYGQQNTGDDAFLAVAAWGACKYLGTQNLWATARVLPQTFGRRVRPALFPWEFHGCGLFQKLRLSRVLPQIDHVIFGGGSNFHTAAQMREFMQLLRMAGRGPHFAVGVSVGPFRDLEAELACSQLCSQLSFIGVRDEASLERIQKIAPRARAELTFDLAPLLPLAAGLSGTEVPKPLPRKGVGVALCNYERFMTGNQAYERKRMDLIINSLRCLAQQSELQEVALLDFNGHVTTGDSQIHELLAKELAGLVTVRHVPYSNNPLTMLAEMAGLRGILAMRLHAAVFAFCAHTPSLMLAYHEKCRQWARMVEQPPELMLDAANLTTDGLIAGLKRLKEQNDVLPRQDLAQAVARSLKNWSWIPS